MPGKVKVKIIAGRNLPVMDRSSDTTDAYVEIKLGSTTYKTDVCRKSLNPQWNSEWYRFEVDDSELQDEPLQIRLMDHDTYSANDAIGKVYLDLNPLLLPTGSLLTKFGCSGESNSNNEHVTNAVMSGWLPVYDTMHGIRGEVNVIVKVELFSDVNKFRQSSCGVQFFCAPVIPHGYYAQMFHGFVEELIVNDDPEYQWIDKIRTPRASNEARQTLFFKLSGELQRKIGLKALELGGNAVVGYSQCFDLEGESGVVVRGIGTAVTLVKIRHAVPVTTTDTTNEEQALSYLQFLGYDSSFHLNSNNIKNPSQSVPSLNISCNFPRNDNNNWTSKEKRNFTRHLSYGDFLPPNPVQLKDNVDSIHHASSLQTLLQQEDMRGNPGTGFSQRLKNFKYSSQNILAKKMTALKAKLSDSGMPEETEVDFKSSFASTNTLDIKKSKPISYQRSPSNINSMAELLVCSLMHSSLDCITEAHSSSTIVSSSSASSPVLPQSTRENAAEFTTTQKENDKFVVPNKFASEPHLIEPEFVLRIETSIAESSSNSSNSSSSDDEDETLSDVKDEANLEFDTVSNIVKNVSINFSTSKQSIANIDDFKQAESLYCNENEVDSEQTAFNLQDNQCAIAPLAEIEDFDVFETSKDDFLIKNLKNTIEQDVSINETDLESTVSLTSNDNFVRSQNLMHTSMQGLDSKQCKIMVSSTPPLDKYKDMCSDKFLDKQISVDLIQPISPNTSSNSKLTSANDKKFVFNAPSSCLSTISPSVPVSSELDKGNNNMHASLAHSLRANGSPAAETVRNDQGHHRTESVGAKISQSPARFHPIPFMHRRSSDSDLSITPKGNSLTGSDKSYGLPGGYFSRIGGIIRPSVPQDNFDMLEYPFLTLSKYPSGLIMHLGGVVSARSVKLLERITNLEEPESRDIWWTELRMEIRSHARSIGCNAVLAYSETSSICDDICVLSASGTAAVIGYQYTGEIGDTIGSFPLKSKLHYAYKDAMASSLDHNDFEREKLMQKSDCILLTNIGFTTKPLAESPENDPQSALTGSLSPCTICHLPYAGTALPLRSMAVKCAVCRNGRVPDILLSTIEMPEGVPSMGRGCFIQAHVCRQLKDVRNESGAKDISDGLPFLEYELHRILVNKIKIKGMNAVFGLKVRISLGVKMLVGIATGTGVYLLPLPSPSLPKLVSDRSTDERKLTEMQKLLSDTVQINREIYQLKEDFQSGRTSPDNDACEEEQPVLDVSAESRDCCILEVDDPEDMEIMNFLMEPRPPDGFHVVNTEMVPGLDELEIVKNLQMFTQIWRAKLHPPYNLGKHVHKLLQSVYFKLRRMIPCALCDLQFRVDLPESDEIQLSVLGMALGLGISQNTAKHKRKNLSLKESSRRNDEDMIFNLEDDQSESNSWQADSTLNIQAPKHRGKSPQRNKFFNAKQHVVHRERHGVDITPLSYVPGGKVERYLGNLSFFFIRETTSIREEGGLSGFIHSFITEVLAIVRAHVAALGGNAMIGYYMTKCVLSHSVHKNQGQCLINVGGDVVLVSYFTED